MFAFLEWQLLALRNQVVTLAWPCLVHILHRSVVPMLIVDNMNTELYRLGHVLGQHSYWATLFRGVLEQIERRLTVLHHMEPPPQNRQVAREVIWRLGGMACRQSS